jgi:uncharacterized Ntn-hydrolase superfamily protein
MTYSIVARDPATGQLGVGVQSHFLAVGSVATFAEPGVGAIATQAFASRQYGPLGLRLLRSGSSAPEVLKALVQLDRDRELRQLGVVDGRGGSASFTGRHCVSYSEHRNALDVAVQGNMLAAFRRGTGDLASRILDALDAAQQAGGDARGTQSASLSVLSDGPLNRPWDAVVHDERVDDSIDPLRELRRLVGLRRTYRALNGVLFDHGPLFSPVNDTDPVLLKSALEDLAASAVTLRTEFGDAYYEADLWHALLLARHGQAAQASALIQPLLRRQPSLAVFVKGLGNSEILEPEVASRLARAGTPVEQSSSS